MKTDLSPVWGKFSSLPWLKDRTIFLSMVGSQSYGLATPTSDEDFKGICIPPRDYFLGFMKKFEQAECNDPDLTIFDIRKFFNLAADCNPSIIELLFTDPKYTVLELPHFFFVIWNNRDKFLSKKAKYTFSGYAISQLKRIKLHRNWLLHPKEVPPTREQFDLPGHSLMPRDQLNAAEAAIKLELDGFSLDLDGVEPDQRIKAQIEIDRIRTKLMQLAGVSTETLIGRTLGYSDNFLELLDKERNYRNAKRQFEQYQNWKATRNPARAILEAKYLYDTKSALHLIRLLRMAKEIAQLGKVLVERPDREELLAIRNGAWTYEQVVEYAEKEEKALDQLFIASKLPNSPDRAFLDGLCVEIVEEFNSKG